MNTSLLTKRLALGPNDRASMRVFGYSNRVILSWCGGWIGSAGWCRPLGWWFEELLGKGIGFRSLCDGVIDTTTASGELIFNLFSALAQFERRLIQERTKAGLSAARARGRKGGRKPLSSDDPRVQMAKRMYHNHAMSINRICRTLKISRATSYRYIALPDKTN